MYVCSVFRYTHVILNERLTLSLPCLPRRQRKTTNKSAKFETIMSFLPPLLEHMKGFLSKCTVLEVDLL